jgi:hypothetical protein
MILTPRMVLTEIFLQASGAAGPEKKVAWTAWLISLWHSWVTESRQ